MSKFGFTHLVNEQTHTQGGIIDHCYISKDILQNDVALLQKAVYYTKHEILEVQYSKTCNMIWSNKMHQRETSLFEFNDCDTG